MLMLKIKEFYIETRTFTDCKQSLRASNYHKVGCIIRNPFRLLVSISQVSKRARFIFS